MSSAKRKSVTNRLPMLTLPSWSSIAPHMLSSRKMLKMVSDIIHPCRTSSTVFNQSPMLPLNRAALWALPYRFPMTHFHVGIEVVFPHSCPWCFMSYHVNGLLKSMKRNQRLNMNRLMKKPIKWHVRPVNTQIRLGWCPVWSESSLSAWGKLGSLATHWTHSKTLIRPGGCPGWSESSLDAQSCCWFCHEAAHICSVVLLPALKPYCSSAMISSASG